MADENTEDLSMEDILSSIRDILTDETPIQKDQAPADVPSAVPEIVSEPVFTPQQTLEVSPAEPVMDELSVAATEDDVFDLSPAMIVNNDPLAQDLDYPAETPNEVTENDILDLSRLVSAGQPEVAELSASLEEPAPAAVEETEATAAFSDSAGIDLSAVLGNQESFNVDDISLDLDNIPDSEPAFPTAEQTADQPQDLAAAIPSLDFDLPKVDVDADPIFAPEEKTVSELSSQQLMESIPASADENVAEEEDNIIDDAALDEILNLHSQAEETHPEEVSPSIPQIQEKVVAAETETAEIQAPVEEPVSAEVSEPAADATDVSANIINNFAKLFAEKKAAEAAAEAPVVENHLPLKTDSVSVGELVRDAVVKQVTEQMTANFEIFARDAVAAQTQAWLDANLPAIVEAVVSKEIERVMAKVGS